MPGRWNDEWRAEGYGRGVDRERGRWDERGRDRWEGNEERSFGRDRVFGERESGMGYNQPRDIPSSAGRGGRGRGDDAGLKAVATGAIPKVQAHLDKVHELQAKK